MSIYQSIFNLISTYIFGVVEVGTYQELVCILFSTFATCFMIALPFIVVYKVAKFIVGE